MNVLDIFRHIWAIIQKGLTYPRAVNLVIRYEISARERIVSFSRDKNGRDDYTQTMIVLSSPHTSVTFNIQISTRRVNAVRLCMSELMFHLLQPQLQISFADDLRWENASYICICFMYVAEFIFPSPCLASTC